MNDKELDHLLSQWKAPESPPWLKAKVMQAVREESARPTGVFALWRNSLSSPRIALAFAAVVLLSVVTAVFWNNFVHNTAEMAALEDALDSFSSFSNQELSSWGAEDPF